MADITATPANNGIPGAIQMPQGSGATSIDESGVARNIKGNTVGNVQTAVDPYASYGGSSAPATNAATDPYASYGGQATNATSEDPYAAYQKTPEQEYKELPWYKRLGKRFAASSALGVPDTAEEATPTGTDYALMATGAKTLTDAAKMIYGYGKTAIEGAHEAGQEMGEAVQNVAEGGPVGANVGKFTGGFLHGVLSATPFVGPVVERGGQDWSQGDYAGAVGDMLGAISQIEGHNIAEPILRTNAQALKVADTKYQTADAVHTARVRELDVHQEQVKAANDAAVKAKEAEQDGTGTRQQTTEANNVASEAAAQAKKAATALNDAYEAKQKASYDRETAARKLARDLQKDKDKVNEKQTKASAAAREDSMKSAPSADSGPAKYSQRDWEIARGYEEAEHANEPINNIQERAEALQKISDDIDNRVGNYVQKYAEEPITTNVHMDVRDALADNPRADFVDKGMAALDPYDLTDPSMSEAQSILTQLNAENRAVLKKNFWDVATALRVDPEFAARYAAADSLRNGMDGTLVDHDVEGIRELRRDQSSIIRVKNAVDKVALKGSQILRQSGQSGLARKVAGWGIRKAGNVVGGGIGTMFGHPVLGTMVGGDVASHIGAPYLKGDISRDMLHQRSMKITGAGVPIAEVTGPGTPSVRPGFAPPPPPTDALSQHDMLQLQREGSDLHGQLAALYPNVPIDSPEGTYSALEQRFLQDMSDKTRNGQKLESNESKLREAIIKQDVADKQAVQEMQQEQAEKEANGDKPPLATLPENYEPVMPMRGRMQKGMDTQKGLVHDYVHAYFGDLLFGDKLPSEGILSHLHPDADGNLAIAAFDWKNFEDEEGYLDPKKIGPRINDFAAMYLSGGIANDLWHGIPLGENLHLGADMYQLERMMNSLKIPDAQQTVILQTALQKVVGELSKPGVQEVFHDHAAVREPGLAENMHASPERIKQIVADLKGVDYEEGNEPTGGNEGANGEVEPGAEGREGKGGPGQAEGKSKEAIPEAVGREPKGNAEGKGEGAESGEERIRAENPSVQEARTEVAPEEAAEEKAKEREKERIRAQNPPLGEAPELTHRTTEKGGEVRLDTEQEGQTKNRGLLKYTKNPDNTAAVTAMNLDQHFRGQGLGQQMYERAADELRKQGVTHMTSDLGGQTSFDAGKVWDRLSEAHPGEIEKVPSKAGSPGYRWDLNKVKAENPALAAIKDKDHPWIAAAKKKFTATRPGQPASIVYSDGSGVSGLNGVHSDVLEAMPKTERTGNDEADLEKYLNETKGMRTGPMEENGQFFQGPSSGFSDSHIAVIRKAVREKRAPIGIEVKTPGGFISKTFEFPLASEVNKFINETNDKLRGENPAPLEKVKAENPALAEAPKGISTGNEDFDKMIRDAGGVPKGTLKGMPEVGLEHHALYDDQNKSTLATKFSQMTPENIKANLDRSHLAYAPENAVKTQAATGGFSFNPHDGSVPTDGYMVETHLDRGKDLGHVPTAEDIKQYMADNKDVLDANKNLHIGGWGNTLGISERIPDLDTALKAGKDRNQIAIYDLKNGKDIQTGGTGEVKIKPEEANPAFAQSDRVSTRVPTAKPKAGYTPEEHMGPEPLTVGMEAVKKDPRLTQKLADVVQKYPDFKIPKGIKDPAKILDRFVGQMKDNLLHVYDSVELEKQKANAKWYESVNKKAINDAAEHGIEPRQAAGTYASLSPQKDWDMNADLARRTMDVHFNHADQVGTPKMKDFGQKLVDQARAGAEKNKAALEASGVTDPKIVKTKMQAYDRKMKNAADLENVVNRISSQKYSDIKDPYEKGVWVRLYDETNNPRNYPKIDPGTGNALDDVTTNSGAPAKVAWGSMEPIARAVSILMDGSRENISEQLGGEHKVRNFYNNIIDPTNNQDITADTHAVAAAHMQPFSGNSKEVSNNFGGAGKSASTGVHGAYPLYAEAYRQAAAERGILPREMQSVTWEKIREMFPAEIKDADFQKQAKSIWKKYADGKASLEDTRTAIENAAEERRSALKPAKAPQPKPEGITGNRINALDFIKAMKDNKNAAGVTALGGQ